MYVTRKILMKVDLENQQALNRASYLASRCYNLLLEERLKNANLITINLMIKAAFRIVYYNPELKALNKETIYSIARRAFIAYKNYQNGLTKKLKFHSNKVKWFSLCFKENVMINKNNCIFKLGRENIYFKIKGMSLNKLKILSYRITLEDNNYYLIILIEKEKAKLQHGSRAIAIDPNHENFFMAVDNMGNSYRMENLDLIYYYDERIREVKQKRAKLLREKNENPNYTSRRYQMYSRVLDKLFLKRKRAIKEALYKIGNYLVDNFDLIAIGDYVPRLELASNKRMSFKMLYETVIGDFRNILEYLCKKKGKVFIKVDERYTTARCFNCGYLEKKPPEIRMFECKVCHLKYNRDINSAINIGIKCQLMSAQDYVNRDLRNPTYALSYNPFNGLSLKKLNE